MKSMGVALKNTVVALLVFAAHDLYSQKGAARKAISQWGGEMFSQQTPM